MLQQYPSKNSKVTPNSKHNWNFKDLLTMPTMNSAKSKKTVITPNATEYDQQEFKPMNPSLHRERLTTHNHRM